PSAPGVGPCRLELRQRLLEAIRRASAHDPAGAVAGGAPERGRHGPAEDHRRCAVGRHGAADADLLPVPELMELLALAIESAASSREVHAACLEVVLPSPHGEAEREAAA